MDPAGTQCYKKMSGRSSVQYGFYYPGAILLLDKKTFFFYEKSHHLKKTCFFLIKSFFFCLRCSYVLVLTLNKRDQMASKSGCYLTAVLFNRVHCTPKGVPQFLKGVPL